LQELWEYIAERGVDPKEGSATPPQVNYLMGLAQDQRVQLIGETGFNVGISSRQNPDLRFDLVFIDGGHDYETARADVVNLRSLCKPETAVVMDDLVPWSDRFARLAAPRTGSVTERSARTEA
jgi:hypothetical protein